MSRLDKEDLFELFSVVYVVTLLFIGTSPNVFTLLKPGLRFLGQFGTSVADLVWNGTETEFERGSSDGQAF